MRTLTRVVMVLVTVALAAPALACSDMQQTTAQTKTEQPAVVKAPAKQSTQTAAKKPSKTDKAPTQSTVATAN